MNPALLTLESFLTLSEAMVDAAEAQEWESLVQLDEKRSGLSENLPAAAALKQLPPVEQARARAIFERCLQLDGKTRLLVGDRQKELRVLLRDTVPVT